MMHWTGALVTAIGDVDFEDVTRAGARIQESVRGINRQTIEEALVVGQLTVKGLETVVFFVDLPEFYRAVVNCRKSQTVFVVELEIVALLVVLVTGRYGAL